jgi:hypothetical protein
MGLRPMRKHDVDGAQQERVGQRSEPREEPREQRLADPQPFG